MWDKETQSEGDLAKLPLGQGGYPDTLGEHLIRLRGFSVALQGFDSHGKETLRPFVEESLAHGDESVPGIQGMLFSGKAAYAHNLEVPYRTAGHPWTSRPANRIAMHLRQIAQCGVGLLCMLDWRISLSGDQRSILDVVQGGEQNELRDR